MAQQQQQPQQQVDGNMFRFDNRENCQPEEELEQEQNEMEAENEEEKAVDVSNPKKATPAVVRTRQFRNLMETSSPSDSIMSPFSQKLCKRVDGDHVHHPASFLKNKHKPKRLAQVSPPVVPPQFDQPQSSANQ